MFLPKRYQGIFSFEPKSQEQKEAFDALKGALFDNVIFLGKIGTGKTHIAAVFANLINKANERLINSSHRAGKPVVGYITEYKLLELHDRKFSKSPEVATEAYREINKLKSVEILILDEVGKRVATEKQMIFMEEFLSERYNDLLKNIIISNLSIPQLRSHFGSRLSSRLRDGVFKQVTFTGEDLRGKIKKEPIEIQKTILNKPREEKKEGDINPKVNKLLNNCFRKVV